MGVRGARTITVSANCRKGNSFTLTYAAAEAPTVAGPYTFVTSAVRSGARVPLSPQPVVTVDPGPTSRLAVTGLADAVGAEQAMTVTAEDEFGNTTPNYRGTVHFAGSGPPAAWVQKEPLFPGFNRFDGFDLPGDYGFTAADAGAHTFTGVKIIFAGDQKVTASDTQDDTITGSQTVTITPGSSVGLGVLAPVSVARRERLHVVSAQIPKQRLTIGAFDSWGNVDTSDNSTLTFTWGMAGGGTPGDLPATLTLVNGTASYDVTWPTRANGDVRILMQARSTKPGPLPPGPGQPAGMRFTMPVEIDADPVASNAQVITVPPSTPGGDPTYQFTVPDQNLTIVGTLSVTTVADPAGVGPIELVVTGVTIGGDTVETSLTVSDPVDKNTGLILDLGTQSSPNGSIIINNATGTPVVQPGDELKVGTIDGFCARPGPTPGSPCQDPPSGVETICGNCVSLSSTAPDGRNQLMVATAVQDIVCPAGKTWSILDGACV